MLKYTFSCDMAHNYVIGCYLFLEFEPLDTEKEKFFQHELMNRFDEQLVTTTQLRKTGPHLVRSHMKKMIRPELKHLV